MATPALADGDPAVTEYWSQQYAGLSATMTLQGDLAVGTVTNSTADPRQVVASNYLIGPDGEHAWSEQQLLDRSAPTAVAPHGTTTVSVHVACGAQTQSDAETADSSGNYGLPGRGQLPLAAVLTTRACPSGPPSTPGQPDKRDKVCHWDDDTRTGVQSVTLRHMQPKDVPPGLPNTRRTDGDFLLPASGNCGPTTS